MISSTGRENCCYREFSKDLGDEGGRGASPNLGTRTVERVMLRGGLEQILQPSTVFGGSLDTQPHTGDTNKCGNPGLQDNSCLYPVAPTAECHLGRERHTGLANIVKYLQTFIP